MTPIHGGLILAQLIRASITDGKEIEKANLELQMLQIKADVATSMLNTWTEVQSSLAQSKIDKYSLHLQWVLSALAKDRENLQDEKAKLTEEKFNTATDNLRLAYISSRVNEIQIVLNQIRLEEQLCMQQTNISISEVSISLSEMPKLLANQEG